jgi:hypothetical protein
MMRLLRFEFKSQKGIAAQKSSFQYLKYNLKKGQKQVEKREKSARSFNVIRNLQEVLTIAN